MKACCMKIKTWPNHYDVMHIGICQGCSNVCGWIFVWDDIYAILNDTIAFRLPWCYKSVLTHWGWVTHICVSKLTIIGSDNGLLPERRQVIIWTNDGISLIGPLGTNFSEISIKIQTFSLKKMRLKISSVKCCSFRLGLNVLNSTQQIHQWQDINIYTVDLCDLITL